ncbi:Transposase [Streptomyces yunnanensis]|uniref:Transposase n=1 Tax=Streptomyces yunnanensis TaxID=156453 RepID=A0A9X8N912_9ACTN|nr:Transposase [Streptomyces yunnanensis]
MSERKPYPSDLSDARWALIEPTLTAWRKARLDRRPTGQPAKVDLRDVFNAILYVNRTGIPWKYLPHDFPNHGTVYAYYAAWRDEGIFAQLNYDLTGLARVKEGRKPEPTASVIDTQSVKTSSNVPLTSQGTDAAKKIVGRKRGILTDTIGLILAVTVTAAGLSENALGMRLLDQAKEKYPTISKSWVDTGFKKRRRRARRLPRNRCRSRQQEPGYPRVSRREKTLGGRAEYRLDHDAPPSGPPRAIWTPSARATTCSATSRC